MSLYRDGLGATATVTAGPDKQSKTLNSGGSYLSSSELILTFGLANHAKADTLEIHWPSGAVDTLQNIAADQVITMKEGSGIVASASLAHR